MKVTLIHFSGDARKTTVMEVLEIIRKISLVGFLLKNWAAQSTHL